MKPIKDFPSYTVDKDGTVATKDGKILTHSKDNMGYLTVTLRKDGKSYTKRVHRLVGEAYLKPVKGKNIINHIDGNKSNPSIKNLEYMSNSENTKHGYDTGLYKSTSMLPVIVTGCDGSDEREFRSIRSLSDELCLNRKTVSSILNENRDNNYNYIFKYKEASDMSYIEHLEKEAKDITHYEAGENQSKADTFKKAFKAYGWMGDSNKRNAYVKQELAKQQRKPSIKDEVRQVDINKPKNPKMKYFKNQRGEMYEVTPEKYKIYEDYAKANNLPFEKIANENKKASIYLDEICKQAGYDMIPSDYSKVKSIELGADDFRTVDVRDMNLHEKIKDNAKNIGEKAKKAKAKAKYVKAGIKYMSPAGKALLAAGVALPTAYVAGSAMATRELLRDNDKKKNTRADKSRDKDIKQRVFRDDINPENKRSLVRLPGNIAMDAVTMMAVAPKTIKAGRKIGGKIGELSGDKLLGEQLGGMVGGIAATAPKVVYNHAIGTYQDTKEFDRLKKRYFEKGVTDKEKKDIKKDNLKRMHKATAATALTPEERIQKMRASVEKKKSNMDKEASEKWSKQDRKGYAKNVAIGVTQDFLNAGNPLNVGSSIVGSIADSALLERSSLNLNKKLKKQEVSKNTVDKYNKTVGLKNGTTAVNTAGKMMSRER